MFVAVYTPDSTWIASTRSWAEREGCCVRQGTTIDPWTFHFDDKERLCEARDRFVDEMERSQAVSSVPWGVMAVVGSRTVRTHEECIRQALSQTLSHETAKASSLRLKRGECCDYVRLSTWNMTTVVGVVDYATLGCVFRSAGEFSQASGVECPDYDADHGGRSLSVEWWSTERREDVGVHPSTVRIDQSEQP